MAKQIEKMSRVPRGVAFWSLPAAEVLGGLTTGSEGITSAEAASRLVAAGPNRLKKGRRTGTLRLLSRQFASPLVLLLAFAAALSLAVHAADNAIIILIILLASGLLGFWQEWGTADAVRKLLSMVALRTRVLRDGQSQEVPLAEVVPGDVVLLASGAVVPLLKAASPIRSNRRSVITPPALRGRSTSRAGTSSTRRL